MGLGLDDSIELDIDLGEETEKALKEASTNDIIDLAGVLGLHSMMNQEQYHSAQSEKWSDRPDPSTGWSGVTKATPLKEFPPEEPNRTDPEEIINKIKSGDRSLKTANLNNIPISEERFLAMCESLRNNEVLEELSLANTTMGDFVAANLAAAIESNTKLLKLNIESNNVSPQCLVKIFEVNLLAYYLYIGTLPLIYVNSCLCHKYCRQQMFNKFCKTLKQVTRWPNFLATRSKWL